MKQKRNKHPALGDGLAELRAQADAIDAMPWAQQIGAAKELMRSMLDFMADVVREIERRRD